MGGKRYSEETKRSALRAFAFCGNLAEVSREKGIPKTTLADWVYGNAGLVEDFKAEYRAAETEDSLKQSIEFKDRFLPSTRQALLDLVRAVQKVLEGPKITGQEVSALIRELTKALQLIEGEPTERHEHTIWDRFREAIKEEEG